MYKTIQKVIDQFFKILDRIQFVGIHNDNNRMRSMAIFPDSLDWNIFFTYSDTKLYCQGHRVQVLARLPCAISLILFKSANPTLMHWIKQTRVWTFTHQFKTLTTKNIGFLVNANPTLVKCQHLATQLYYQAQQYAKHTMKMRNLTPFDVAVCHITEFANEADVGPDWQLLQDSIMTKHITNTNITTLAQVKTPTLTYPTTTMVKNEVQVIEVICEAAHATTMDKTLKEALTISPNRPCYALYTYKPNNKHFYLWLLTP